MLTFLLMTVDQKESDKILSEIKNIDKGVENKIQKKINHIYEIFGEYDLLVKIKSHDENDARSVIQNIQKIKGINSIKTLVALHQTSETDILSKEKIIYH